jgi:hypothetical protein
VTSQVAPLIYGPQGEVLSGQTLPPVAADERICVVCGCTDSRACDVDGEPCSWAAVARTERGLIGVCTACDDPFSAEAFGG